MFLFLHLYFYSNTFTRAENSSSIIFLKKCRGHTFQQPLCVGDTVEEDGPKSENEKIDVVGEKRG